MKIKKTIVLSISALIAASTAFASPMQRNGVHVSVTEKGASYLIQHNYALCDAIQEGNYPVITGQGTGFIVDFNNVTNDDNPVVIIFYLAPNIGSQPCSSLNSAQSSSIAFTVSNGLANITSNSIYGLQGLSFTPPAPQTNVSNIYVQYDGQ